MKRILAIIVVLLVLAGSGYLAAEKIANARMKGEIDAEIEKYREDADITYGKLNYDLSGGEATMTDFRVAAKESGAGEVKVDKMVVTDFKPKKDGAKIPPLLHLKANGIHLSEEATAHLDLDDELKDLGYETPPRIDAEIDYEYDLETKQLVVRKVSLLGDEMGELSLAISLDNFTPPPSMEAGQRPNSMQLMAMLSGLSIRSLEVTFEDNGLTNRMLDRGAEIEGITREEFVTKLLGDLRNGFKSNASTLNRQALGAIEQFLDNPERLKITAQPASPVSVASLVAAKFLGGDAQIPQMLGVEVSN